MDGLLMAAARLSSRIEDVPWDLIAEKIVEKHSDAQCEARFRFLNKMRGRSESDLEDSDAAGDCVSDADGPLEPEIPAESAEEADWPAVDEEDPPRSGRQPGRQAWTEEDDQRLRDAVADGLTWAGIAGRMPTHTLNGCRTRWRRIGPGA
jgi:hypothetical protein